MCYLHSKRCRHRRGLQDNQFVIIFDLNGVSCTSACLFVGTVANKVALFPAFEASASLLIFLAFFVVHGFVDNSRRIHSIIILRRKTWLRWCMSRTESATSRIQRIPSPSSPKAAPKPKYSHVAESTLRPRDPGKLSPDLSRARSRDISTTLGSRDIQARDPGKVSYDLPRDWSSTRSQVTTRSPDRTRFRCVPSPLIGTWKTVGTINGSTNQ